MLSTSKSAQARCHDPASIPLIFAFKLLYPLTSSTIALAYLVEILLIIIRTRGKGLNFCSLSFFDGSYPWQKPKDSLYCL